MIYALGRGLEAVDMPAIRKIVRDASEYNYRFSSLIAGVIQSTPFQVRIKSTAEAKARAVRNVSVSAGRPRKG
jgi:hypothetical protein